MFTGPGEDEFLRTIDRYQHVIIGECIRAVESGISRAVEVEDLVQEVHLRLWERLPDVRSARNQGAYVRTCARNAIRNALRGVRNCPEPMEFREAVG